LRLGTKASLLLTKEAAKSANEILTSSCCSRVISANIGSDKMMLCWRYAHAPSTVPLVPFLKRQTFFI